MECKCRTDSNSDEAAAGVWLSDNSVQMGAVTLVGYLLYRFSQTTSTRADAAPCEVWVAPALPALIRWPIRLFCSLTGLSALWGWVSRLVGTIRGLQTLFKWLSRVWHFIGALSSKFKWLLALVTAVARFLKRSKQRLESPFTHSRRSSKERLKLESDQTVISEQNPSRPRETGLRLILLGPSGGGRTSLASTLLGSIVAQTRMPAGPLMESTKQTMLVDGREVTVIDTPDLLGASLGDSERAWEALRSVQLASPGPHAFLLVIRAPGSSSVVDQDASQAVRATLQLFGDEARGHIVPVLTHADRLSQRLSLDQLLDVDAAGLKAALSLCGQRPELVGNRPDGPPEVQAVVRGQLLGRVTEMEALRGHFVHELQRREDSIRKELLTDMASALSRKLGHM